MIEETGEGLSEEFGKKSGQGGKTDKKFGEIEVPEILPPSDDGVFKTLLTHPNARSCLRDIISSNIGLPVTEVTVRNTEFPISDILEKRERFDVSCEIDGGGQVEVEMQADPMNGDSLAGGHRNIRSRAIYNACDLHSSQSGIGVQYGDLARTYQITFCGYTVFDGREDCFNRFSFRNKDGEELHDAVSIIFVELSKLSRIMRKPVAEMTAAEIWALFLACANKPGHRSLIGEVIAAREEIRMAYDPESRIIVTQNEEKSPKSVAIARNSYRVTIIILTQNLEPLRYKGFIPKNGCFECVLSDF